jgi:hypothetical protein
MEFDGSDAGAPLERGDVIDDEIMDVARLELARNRDGLDPVRHPSLLVPIRSPPALEEAQGHRNAERTTRANSGAVFILKISDATLWTGGRRFRRLRRSA